jgi:hypothetical protein
MKLVKVFQQDAMDVSLPGILNKLLPTTVFHLEMSKRLLVVAVRVLICTK